LWSIVLKEKGLIQDIRASWWTFQASGIPPPSCLVMRTRGVISTPPDSCRVQWGVGVDQNNIGYY